MGLAQVARSARSALLEAVHPARLLLAAKTALAVGAAWLIAPLLPGVTDDYPYYAPLGALISMYPTLMSSVRSSLQTLLGLSVGVGLAAVVVLTVGPSVWSVAIAVGVATLISGTGWFGVGKEYIPIAALFVLIIGGANADDYSLGYATQMAVGITIGLVVNMVFPPAPLDAGARIDAFQRRLANHLHDIGDAVAESWPPQHEGWDRESGALAETNRSLRDALAEADDSRRGNPRAWRRHSDRQEQHAQLERLGEIAYQIRDISGCLGDTIWDRPGALPLDAEIVDPLSRACHAVAEYLEDRTHAGEDDQLAARASDAVDQLVHAVHTRSIDVDLILGPGVLTAMHLQRILLIAEQTSDDPES
ncbi:aromatic acid exporter family protein [Microbacterium sp. Mu-80]|uniref:Aromatic acid exporter family protein n=1 Tax=Microbacterium bandirmense TaxID=3122050 RepID=A0ABU8LBF9_9MICO